MLDIPTGTANGMNEEGAVVTTANGMNNDGTIIVGIAGMVTVREQFLKPIYWKDGSPPTIRNIGFLRDGTYGHLYAVNGDGDVAVGEGDTTNGVVRAFRWKRDSTPPMQDLGVLDGCISSYANDLNNAGNIIVGNSHAAAGGESHATRWNDTSGTLRIEKLRAPQDATNCVSTGINDDGPIIVGHCRLSNGYGHAVCWLGGQTTEVTTLECLGSLSHAVAFGVSGDGNVIVGSSTEPGNPNIVHAVRWKRDPGTNRYKIENLNVHPEPPQDTWRAGAGGVNHDGTVIGGTCRSGDHTSNEAFIWMEDPTPQVHKLPDITQGYKRSGVHDVIKKDDGNIIAVGYSMPRNSEEQIAVRWKNLSSIENLNFPT